MRRAIRSIVGIALLAALVFGVVMIYRFTNGFNEDFKTFYLINGGERIVAAESVMTFERGAENEFGVRYTFDTKKSQAKDYNVRIIPNGKADFEYYVEGRKTAWKGEKDLTKLFSVKKAEKSFTLTVAADTTFERLLQEYYAGKELDVGGAAEYEAENPYLYDLVVSSYNDGVVYHIRFAIAEGGGDESNT